MIMATVLVCLLPAPAHAAQAFDFHTEYGGWSLNSNPGGRASADGQVTFPGKHRVVIDLWAVKDWCNGEGTNDGLGAWLTFSARLYYPDGGQIGVGGWTATYKAACGGFTYGYDINWHAPDGAVITGVIFYLEECSDAGRCSSNAKDQAKSRLMDNPWVSA